MRGKICIKKNFDEPLPKELPGSFAGKSKECDCSSIPTYFFGWLSDDRKLAKNARDIIANPNNEVIVSSASAWEIVLR